MKRFLWALAAAFVLGSLGCSSTQHGSNTASQDFGQPDARLNQAQPLPADAVLRAPADYNGKQVVVTGTVNEVCPKKGCWLTMTDRDVTDTIFVKFTCPIEGRLIPLNAAGCQVVVAGELQQVQVSEDYARHLAEDRGLSPEEVEKIQGPQPMLRINSPSARVFLR